MPFAKPKRLFFRLIQHDGVPPTQPDKKGQLFIKRLIPGGPAEKLNALQVPQEPLSLFTFFVIPLHPPFGSTLSDTRDIQTWKEETYRAAARRKNQIQRPIQYAHPVPSAPMQIHQKTPPSPSPRNAMTFWWAHRQVGDVLHSVDGVNVVSMNRVDVASLLGGDEGSRARLRFLRPAVAGDDGKAKQASRFVGWSSPATPLPLLLVQNRSIATARPFVSRSQS